MENFDLRLMKEICQRNHNKGLCGSGKCECEEICDTILKEGILPKNFDLKVPGEEKIYSWVVTEDDGYTYCETGSAYDIVEATWKACEYSPSHVKNITVARTSETEFNWDEDGELYVKEIS